MRKILKKIIVYILFLESKMILRKFNPYIIGVVGAVGKTTTKDSVASIFKNIKDENGHNLKYIATKKSLNSEFGVPLTIIGADSGWDSILAWLKIIIKGIKVYLKKDYAKYLILEVGADQKGDIKSISEWLHCDVVIVTAYGNVPVHVENFKNRNELIREDEYLVKSLKEKGVLIYNEDCEDACDISDRHTKEKSTKEKLAFTIKNTKNTECKAKAISNDIRNKKVTAQVSVKNNLFILECDGVVGEAAISCALPALIVSNLLALDMKNSIKNIKEMERSPGRMRVLEGKNSSAVIDDSYNSSPVAVSSGLKTLKSLTGHMRKIIILGDMLELGKYTKEEHLKIGKEAASSGNILITVGNRAKFIAEGARDSGMGAGWILECGDSESAGEEVLNILKTGDIVYVKGSQSIRLEKAVKMLVSENVDIKKDIVRQSSEWLAR